MSQYVSPPGTDCRGRGARRAARIGVLAAAALVGGAVVGLGQVPTGPSAVRPPTALPGAAVPGGVPGLFPTQFAPPQTQPGQPAVVPAPGGQPKAGPAGGPYAGPLGNPLLSAAPPGLGGSPPLTPAARDKLTKYVARLIDPETTLDLAAGQTRVLVLKNNSFRVQSGNDQVLAVNVISPKELLVQGKGTGATVLNIWFGDPNDPTRQETLTYLVRVFPDPEAKERLERAYRALEDDINRHFPDARVRLKVLGDKLVVTGRVRDFVQGGQVLQVIRANAGGGAGQAGGVAAQPPLVPAAPAGAPTDPTGATTPPTAESFQTAGGPNVLNLLEVAGEQQVMLRVVVAEVNRAAARSIGLNFSVQNNQGLTVFTNRTGPVVGFNGAVGPGGPGAALGNGGFGGALGLGGTIANVPFQAGRVPFALNALKSLQYARSMAEPNLVTMNGQTASFLAGGQFPVPVIGGFGSFGGGGGGGGGLQGVQYVPFGVQLAFTPFITDRDRVRINLNASVSTRDIGVSTSIGGGSVAGLNSRNVNTTVELRQGETLAVAGLIESNLGADATKIPFVGDIPGLAPLTGLIRTQAGEKELVIFLTPELVRPLDPDQAIPLPGREILDPNDLEFYVLGRIEGHCKDYRSPIRTDLSRIRMYREVEGANVAGPVGYTPLP